MGLVPDAAPARVEGFPAIIQLFLPTDSPSKSNYLSSQLGKGSVTDNPADSRP